MLGGAGRSPMIGVPGDTARFERHDEISVADTLGDEGAERVVVYVAQVPVGVVEQHDVIDTEHGGRGAKLTVAAHPEVGRGAQRARFAVGQADDSDRGAGVDQRAQQRTETEAFVIRVGDDRDRTPG